MNDTRDRILDAALKLFSENGYEGTSVKMILTEAGAVTGSFYHFFSSKEELFEAAVGKLLDGYTQSVSSLMSDPSGSFDELTDRFISQMQKTSDAYYHVLGGMRMHWTVQQSLHNRTIYALIPPLARALEERIACGEIESTLQADALTLAALLVRGIESILHADRNADCTAKEPLIRDYIHLLIKEKQ